MAERTAVIVALHDLHRNSRILKQAKTLHEAGFDVTAVGIVRRSTDPEREQTSFGTIVRVRTTDNLAEERAVPAGTPAAGPSKPSMKSWLKGLRLFLGRMRENLLLSRQVVELGPDVVIASDLMAWAAGYRAARKVRVPLIVDARDLVTDSGRRQAKPFLELFARVESYVARRADAFTVATPMMAEIMHSRYPAAPEPVSIYNGPFHCVDHAKDTVHEPLRLLFQGNFAPNRGIDEMIKATVALEGSAVLTIQGFGELREELGQLVETLDAQEVVRFVDPCAPEDVVVNAAGHDVGLFWTSADTLNLRISAPIKIFDYMAAGLALVAPRLPGIERVVEGADCARLVDPGDTSAMVATLKELAESPDSVGRMKHNALAACSRYSWDVQGRIFLDVVESAMSGRSK